MKMLLSFAATAALALSTEGVCFGQHYVQTSLDASVQGSSRGNRCAVSEWVGLGSQFRKSLVGF
jgi:hypothetical protein